MFCKYLVYFEFKYFFRIEIPGQVIDMTKRKTDTIYLVQEWILYMCTNFFQNWFRIILLLPQIERSMNQLLYFYTFFIMQTGTNLRIIPLILDQYWQKLVLTYIIHSRTIFVLRVVFKYQYVWSYSRKTDFRAYLYTYFKEP